MKLTEHLFFYPERGMPGCNTYVIKDKTKVIIDPGFEMHLEGLIKDMAKDGIDPRNIDIVTNTHLHLDHCWANQAFKDISGAKIMIHDLHKKHFRLNVIEAPKLFMSLFDFGIKPREFKEDSLLNDKLNTGEMEFELLPAPGHSLDSICFYCRDKKILICGDVVFAQNTGRVDLPGGNAADLKVSIERLSHLDIEYLLPGHLDIVKGKEAVKRNFNFVRENVFPWL